MTMRMVVFMVGGAGALELAGMALAGWWAWRYADGRKRARRRKRREEGDRIVARILGK